MAKRNRRQKRIELVFNRKSRCLHGIYCDDLVELIAETEGTVERASHVEPEAGGWVADLAPVGGPRLGPYDLRVTAVQEEVQWLRANVLHLQASDHP